MIRIRLCQKLPLKFNCLRAPSSTVASSALFIDSPNIQSSLTSQLVHCRHRRDDAATQLTFDPYERQHSLDNSFFPQSITPYRFDDVPNRDPQSGAATGIQVLEQWKQLLENLHAIVESFTCAGTAVHDVSAIRLALEQHHLVRLLVGPYSYNAENVLAPYPATSRVFLHPQDVNVVFLHPQDVNVGSFAYSEDDDVTHDDIAHDNVTHDDVTEESVVDCAVARSSDELAEFRRRSCIERLEHESLRAVMVLTTGAWKPYGAASCEGIDFTRGARGTDARLTDLSSVMLCRNGENESGEKKATDPKGRGLPNRDQLIAVQDYMAENLPKIFVKFHSYDIYTNDVVFENNWYFDKSYVTVGTLSYALEIAKLRLFVHLQYANVKMQLLKATTHDTDGTVRIRWRISGIPQAKAIMFWKFLPWASKSSVAENFEWLDGFSTFFVDNTGLIYKHRMDRVIPDEGPELKKNQTVIEKIATKIASPPAATLG